MIRVLPALAASVTSDRSLPCSVNSGAVPPALSSCPARFTGFPFSVTEPLRTLAMRSILSYEKSVRKSCCSNRDVNSKYVEKYWTCKRAGQTESILKNLHPGDWSIFSGANGESLQAALKMDLSP